MKKTLKLSIIGLTALVATAIIIGGAMEYQASVKGAQQKNDTKTIALAKTKIEQSLSKKESAALATAKSTMQQSLSEQESAELATAKSTMQQSLSEQESVELATAKSTMQQSLSESESEATASTNTSASSSQSSTTESSSSGGEMDMDVNAISKGDFSSAYGVWKPWGEWPPGKEKKGTITINDTGIYVSNLGISLNFNDFWLPTTAYPNDSDIGLVLNNKKNDYLFEFCGNTIEVDGDIYSRQ